MKIKKISNILTIVVAILLVILVFFVKNIYDEIKNASSEEVKVLDTIENYGYIFKCFVFSFRHGSFNKRCRLFC